MYTCNTCSLQFSTPEDQRSHMKSEWHRYNLKRRVASLPAIDEQLFNEKVSKLTVTDEEPDQKVKKEKQLTKKELRKREKEKLLEQKKQLLEIAKQNILNSLDAEGKVIKNPTNLEEKDAVISEANEIKTTVEPVTETESKTEQIPQETTEEEVLAKLMEEKMKNRVDIPPEVCLFCNRKFPAFETCLVHMSKHHGFYIPETKYLVDKAGLVHYMAEKIGIGNLCFVCSFQGRTLEAVRAHMLAKQHCRIPFETDDERLEISEFYDFSSTYADLDEKARGDDDDGDWEDLEDDGDVDVDADSGEDGSDKESVQNAELPQYTSYDDGVQLHLPSGLKVGHRSLVRYFKQNLKPEPVLSEGQGTVIAVESRSMLAAVDKAQRVEQKRIWGLEKKLSDRNDRRRSKFINFQPHYRDQLLQ